MRKPAFGDFQSKLKVAEGPFHTTGKAMLASPQRNAVSPRTRRALIKSQSAVIKSAGTESTINQHKIHSHNKRNCATVQQDHSINYSRSALCEMPLQISACVCVCVSQESRWLNLITTGITDSFHLNHTSTRLQSLLAVQLSPDGPTCYKTPMWVRQENGHFIESRK